MSDAVALGVPYDYTGTCCRFQLCLPYATLAFPELSIIDSSDLELAPRVHIGVA